MGQIEEKSSPMKMAKTSSAGKKGKSSGKTSLIAINFGDPKIQGVLLMGLLAVLALAVWFGFTRGCLGRRRRRRRSCSCLYN